MTALEGTYEYECMRAELLGIDKPDYEEFMKNKSEREEAERIALEAEANKELAANKEHFQRSSARLEELGNILKSTQKKINILTAPLSVYLKSKMGIAGASKDIDPSQSREQKCQDSDGKIIEIEKNVEYTSTTDKPKKDITSVTTNQVPIIDRLIDKCEENTYAMQHQIKQMKKFK